jgi:TetR/AcrR family transcriptional regulator, transcriptional repressor for nem operon
MSVPKTSKVEQKERTHISIIESACKLLRERGIGGAKVAEVMSGAGLTVGGFYAHFDSKEALVDEALRKTAAIMRSRLFERIEEKPLAARAEVVLKRYLTAAHRDDPANGCPFPAVVGEVSTTAPAHRKVLSEQMGILADELAINMPATNKPLAERRSIALGVIVLMYGGISLARAVKDTPLSDEILKSCRAIGKQILG